MKKTPPVIGVSACFFHADPLRAIFKGKTLLYLEESMAHWIESQVAIPWLIPTVQKSATPFELGDFVDRIDGLVLQGGSDVSPKSYGEEPLRPEWGGDFVRDQYEIALLKECIKRKKPVLGACRGLQLINVAYGGTLYQDIGTQCPQARIHRDWNVYDQIFHEVEIVAGSRLAGILSKTLNSSQTGTQKSIQTSTQTSITNTIHHQAIKELGAGLVVEARCAEDGIIEAVRAESDPVFAVQWHPEFHDPGRGDLLPSELILKDFLSALK